MGRCTPETSRSLALPDTSQVLMSDKTHWLSLTLSLFPATVAVTPSSNGNPSKLCMHVLKFPSVTQSNSHRPEYFFYANPEINSVVKFQILKQQNIMIF